MAPKFDLNKYLRLHIRGKLAVAFAGLSIVPVLIVGYLGISSTVQSLQQMAMQNLRHDLTATRERVSAFLQIVEDNVHSVVASSTFQPLLQAIETGEYGVMRERVAKVLPEILGMVERKRLFYQVKFIDRHGDELFAIEKRDTAYHILDESELNRAGTQYHMNMARQIRPNAAVFLPVELRLKNGRDHLPAIGCVYPVVRRALLGVLVFYIPADRFFSVIERSTQSGPAGKMMLANAEGYFLYHSAKKKDWDRLLAARESENLIAEYGEQSARELLAASADSVIEVGRELVAAAPIFPKYRGFAGSYTILKSVSKKEINAPVLAFTKLFLGILGFLLLSSLTLAYFATRQLAGPIRKLRQEAGRIARGDYHSRVDIKTYDEIEDLASQFNLMAEAVDQRERELARHREQLELAVQERTQELRQEKDKLQAILDNVPSGFLLIDRDYKIISASAAMERIAGLPPEKLLGRTCYDVLGNAEYCQHCPSQHALAYGTPEQTFMQRIGEDGEEHFYEHVAVPLKRNGHVESVLEIITDITQRKRLQDQLVHSERLAATGEIAAFIAHEMRNSVTAIRMILQLLRENSEADDADAESLDVALNSLQRIDRVVNDLLQLARPARLLKKSEDLNAIIRDSLALAEHQVMKKGIDVSLELAPDLPHLMLDRDQIKEAIVNLLLNAVQATAPSGSIRVRTTVKKLSRSMRELGEVGILAAETARIGVQEIVLAKGTRAVEVEISDNGSGIAAEDLPRIFNPFFTTKINGTGLGLSFVKRVINEHGGVITVKSRSGKGSSFSLTIPV